MEPRKCSESETDLSSRDRMLELASFSSEILQQLSIDCDSAELYSGFVDNVPLLMICPSPLIDFGTYVEVLKKDYVFPVVRRDMSYSMELCCNNGASMDAGSSQAPPNVNLFAPVNSIRRPVRHRLEPGNLPNGNLELDIYNDIPSSSSGQVMNFEPIRTPSVTSSRLSEYEDYNGLESNSGYVQFDPSVPQFDSNNFLVESDGSNNFLVESDGSNNFLVESDGSNNFLVQSDGPNNFLMQSENGSNNFLMQSEDGVFEQQYFPPQYYPPYPSGPSEIGDFDLNMPSQSTVRNISYIPPLVPYTDAISPIIPDLVTESTPIWINLPILYIIPVIPISIQPVFLAPIEPASFTYMPAPWAFNCVLRTPFPQFIYSVEPCNSPGCPFSYRYRCPTPQIEQPQANECRRSNPCQFRRSGRFNYQCTNRLDDNIEDDTPKRSIENAPPPKRRLSDKFDSPDRSSTPSGESTRTNDSITTIETLTTTLNNTSISMKGDSIGKLSQISVQITSRKDTHNKKKNFPRTSHTIEFRRNKRTGYMKRLDRPRNMCFVRPTNDLPKSIDVIRSAIIAELTRDRRLNWADWLRTRAFRKARESAASSSFSSVNRPYFLNLISNGPLPNVLQEVSVPVINNSVCESMYQSAGYIEHIPNIFICAGWRKGGFDSCEGDSGGPMVIQRPDKRWLLAGIISWGIGCAEPNQPGVYTRISAFRDWINQILQF